ncbi:unnamed protein product [Rangifer tarandus platyrhynchus]|uniref:Uncharacterized protein n=1 Tax=Rangifer tarandus platyrhynchus TaxID=3082113 RepID=A0AC59YST7_RANTA
MMRERPSGDRARGRLLPQITNKRVFPSSKEFLLSERYYSQRIKGTHLKGTASMTLSIYLSSIHPNLSSICISIHHSIYLSITYLSILVYHLSIYASIIPPIYLYLWSVSDAVILTLMVWSSGSMVLLLFRHRQRVQYIHTPTGHHRCPPETRDARTVLMLAVTFVTFYLLDSVFVLYITAFFDIHLRLIQTSNVWVSCFPTISPFLLLLGILELLDSPLELIANMIKVINI